MTDKRTARMQRIGQAIAQDFTEAAQRHSGKTVSMWTDERAQNLLKDVRSGRLNPDRWFPFSKLMLMTRRYGLEAKADGDDLIFANIPTDLIKHWNPKYEVPFHAGTLATKAMAFRMNPEKFAALSNMYRIAA